MLRTILRIGSATSTRSWRSPRTPLQYHRHPLQNVLVARGFAARPRIPPEQNAKRLAAIAAKRKRKDAKALRAAALGDEPLSEPSSKSLLSLWDEIERNNAEDDEDADAASVPTEPIDDERLLQELEALSSSDKPRVAQQARATSKRQTARTTRPSLSLDDDDDDDGNDEDEILALEGVRTEVRMKPVSPEELTTRAEESDRAWIAKALRSHTPLNPYRDVADLSTQQASEIMKDLSPGEQMQMQERLRSQRLGQTRAIAKYINAYYAPAVSWYNNTCNPDDDPNKSADSIPAMQLIEQYLEATTKQPAKSKSSTSPKQAAKLAAAAAKAASSSMAFETIEPDDPNNPPREVNSWERPVARYLNTPTIVRYLDGETTICGARVPRNMLPYLQDPNVPEEQVLSPRRSARLQAYEALLERKKIRKETKHKIVGEGGLTRRQIQYGDLVEAELSRVFVNEPQLEEFRQLRVFVSKAVVSPDLRVAKVYWGCWEPRDTDAAEKRILARQKQIQYLFAKQVEHVKYPPTLVFTRRDDENDKRIAFIERVIDRVEAQRQREEEKKRAASATVAAGDASGDDGGGATAVIPPHS